MKLKLFGIQEVLNEAHPTDCIGETKLFLSQEKRYEVLETLKAKTDEYREYYAFAINTEDELPIETTK